MSNLIRSLNNVSDYMYRVQIFLQSNNLEQAHRNAEQLMQAAEEVYNELDELFNNEQKQEQGKTGGA